LSARLKNRARARRFYLNGPGAVQRYAMFTRISVLVCALLLAGSCKYFGKHWNYEKTDEWEGVCAVGRMQSPVDIQRTVRAPLDPLRLDYNEAPLVVKNNGHTLQVDAAGAGGMNVGDTRFQLLQYHLHARSEHTIKGMSADMELHLVHKDSAGNLAVIGVMLKKGAANPLMKAILENAPRDNGEKKATALANPLDLLPADRGYYTYPGSLTTPDCSEGLKWIVLKQPVEISESQIAQFKTFYGNNARPVQALNNRIVLESD
jgi:carbonic anhydrase